MDRYAASTTAQACRHRTENALGRREATELPRRRAPASALRRQSRLQRARAFRRKPTGSRRSHRLQVGEKIQPGRPSRCDDGGGRQGGSSRSGRHRAERHHGHHDICRATSRTSPVPFAELLRRIYDAKRSQTYGALWTTLARQKVLGRLGYDLGQWAATAVGRLEANAPWRNPGGLRGRELPHWTRSPAATPSRIGGARDKVADAVA